MTIHRTAASRIALAAALLGACGDSSAAPEPNTPVATTIEIADPGLVRDGDVVTLVATVKDQYQRPLPTAAVRFAVTDASVATIDAANRLTALREGATEIVATAGTAQQRRPLAVVRKVPPAIRYRVHDLNGQPLPVVVYEEHITRDDGSTYTLIERLEAGTVAMADRYQVMLTVAEIERTSVQGSSSDRVMRRRAVTDDGQVRYNWLDQTAFFASERVGGLTHDVYPEVAGPRLRFRLGGTFTIWALGLRPE